MRNVPIIILPGWLTSTNKYQPLAHLLAKRGFPAYQVSFPEFESDEPITEALHLTDYVKVLQKFLKQKHIDKAVFLGHSFGGRVALKYLSQEPKKALALVLSGTPGFSNISKLRFYLMFSIAKLGKYITYIPPWLFFRKSLKKLFYKLVRAYDYYRADGFLKQTLKNIIDETLDDYMGKIRLPTLLLWGEKDSLVPVRIAKRMQKKIKNSKLVIVEGAKHNFIYQAPEIATQQLTEFIKGLENRVHI
ncbi:MAG: putative hydrolases or acyltransferases (Alpha/beta hydrolase superfamily) [uncultured bacterium]|nr:MAG: putative hydrolases or acyltransferases (Alpha/beta hydrolase superfamily) [uncultured bacterium]